MGYIKFYIVLQPFRSQFNYFAWAKVAAFVVRINVISSYKILPVSLFEKSGQRNVLFENKFWHFFKFAYQIWNENSSSFHCSIYESFSNLKCLNFMVTPCINNIQHFNFQLMHTTLKNVELLKHFKISKTAPTCFGSQGNHHQGATIRT